MNCVCNVPLMIPDYIHSFILFFVISVYSIGLWFMDFLLFLILYIHFLFNICQLFSAYLYYTHVFNILTLTLSTLILFVFILDYLCIYFYYIALSFFSVFYPLFTHVKFQFAHKHTNVPNITTYY